MEIAPTVGVRMVCVLYNQLVILESVELSNLSYYIMTKAGVVPADLPDFLH